MTRRTIRAAATCSAFALATAMVAAPVAAQSFQGSSTVTFGSATVTTAPNVTDVQVDSASAVIDWTPFDTSVANGAPILFQPTGTTATFHNNDTTQNSFAVLNRIVPVDASRPIIFDGTVISELRSQLAPSMSGGTVFFYSPGGIIVGANAVFNVGNLGLTTAPPSVDANGDWYTGNAVQFGQAAAGTSVRIESGAQINALAESSYVAAFAPQVVQAGTVNVNGQAALVAAEAGTITFSPDGLFDIQVSIGSDETFAIDHSGTTTGPASSGAGDNHRIYMVAVPKNTAIQLAIGRGSEIGFDVAGAADTAGNAVILSAGRNVSGGSIGGVAGGADGASIDINDSSSASSATGIEFTSAVTGSATNDVSINAFHQTNFASNASFFADETAMAAVGMIPSEAPGALTVGGDLTLFTDRFTPFSTAPGDSGQAFLFASDGATVDVAGNLTLRSDAVFDTSGDGLVTGGLSQLLVDTGAAVNVGGDLIVRAGAFTDTTGAGDAVGGTAQIYLFGASTLGVSGVTRVHTYGLAGNETGLAGNGADGTGGFSAVLVGEGSNATFNELNVAADGVGGVDVGSGAGDGFGGLAQLDVSGAGSTLAVQQANVTGDNTLGQLDLVSAEGFGGATALAGSVGGNAQGGTATIVVTDGGNLALPDASSTSFLLRVLGRATGGSASADGSTGGSAVGGTVSVFLDDGTLTGDGFLFSSFAQGGNATIGATGSINGGDAVGGNRNITIQNGSTFSGSATGGPGAVGGRGSATGTGGNGTGGSASLLVDSSVLNVSASGFFSFSQNLGGSGGIGGDATGGNSFVQISNGATVNLAPGAVFGIYANNRGDFFDGASDAAGGNATGGAATLLVENATIAGPGTVEVTASATGGSVLQGQGGNGTGGTAHLQLRGATISVSDIFVDASGSGGSADPAFSSSPPATPGGGNGGAGTGGLALIQADTGVNTLTTTVLDVDADGSGGAAAAAAGNGGVGTGGQSLLVVESGASLAVNGSVALSADAEGGEAGFFDPMSFEFTGIGSGGDGFGGNGSIVAMGGLTVSGDVEVEGEADGGMGITGGNGTAGSFVVQANGGSIAIAGDLLVESGAGGGDGSVAGGNAVGSLDDLTLVNAFVLAESGGSVSVGGTATLETEIEGGFGFDGGSGGDAVGGATVLLAKTNTASSLPSSVTVNDVFAATSVRGGDGGSVASGSGATGGAGGNAEAGTVVVFGDAGNGQLTVNGILDAAATGEGGFGGDGDVGGAAGSGQGGFVQIGTRSGEATPDNTGSGSFTDIIAVASGVGGDGGQGFVGQGGSGGDGGGGRSTLLVRGSTVNVSGVAQLLAVGAGGNGGTGAGGNGAGGDGIVGDAGGIAVIATHRFENPDDRGNLNANAISGEAFAIGGAGSVAGASIVGDAPALISFIGADGTINTLDFIVSGTEVAGTSPDKVSLTDAAVSVGDFSVSTPNDLVLALDGAVLETDTFLLQAREIVLPEAAPVAPGTVVVTSGMQIFVDSGSSIRTFTGFETGFGVDFVVDGDFQTGDFTAAGDIFLRSLTGTVTTGDLAGDTIGLFAAQGILAGDIDANGEIILQTDSGTISVGALSGTAVTASSPDNIVIGDFASSGDVFLQSSTGSLTAGNVSGANVNLFAATDLTAQNVTAAGVIEAQAGGLVTVGGTWDAQTIAVGANDMNIASTGVLNGDEVLIVSTNPSGMFVGDGASSGGFVLDNTEFNRIIAGGVAFGTVDTSNPIDLTVGNLAISSSRIGGLDENGVEFFVFGGSESSSSSGGIRVNGNVIATGFGDEMEIGFFSDLFELNAATGSVSITGNSTSALAGEIEIEANHIHVASDDILLKLRADPLYQGRAADLNSPSQVQRPEGVLRARAIQFYPGGTLYIQNTGTATNPAGFYTTVENSDIEPPGFEDPSAPPVDVIINGRFQGPNGDVTGRDAFDLIVANAESSQGFTETSQVNACTISTSACSAVSTPTSPTNTSEIQALTEDQTEEEPFETEEEDEAEDEASSPITPPVVLINSRPLNPDVDVTDPVSGTGNPALIDATLSDDAQGDPQ